MLRLVGIDSRVNFRTEAANGLVLCPSDLDHSNFMVDSMRKIWAIDFGRMCFLPSSFVYYSLKMSSNAFGQHVARLVNYLKSANFSAMETAAGQLVFFNDNSLGKSPLSIVSRYVALITNCIGT